MFTPLQLGALRLEHRVVMAPLTRNRGTPEFAPGPNSAAYYAERATRGGLLVTEATPISPETPWEFAPGIYTDAQVAGWRQVTDAVHARGGLISLQLWHVGRTAHESWGKNPALAALGRPLPTVSSSAVRIERGVTTEWPSLRSVPYSTPRALSAEEVRVRIVDDYRRAAVNAKRAGFDAVEVVSGGVA